MRTTIIFFSILVFHLQTSSQQPFRIDVDYSTFRYSEQQSYLEIYVAIPSVAITYNNENGVLTASAHITLTLLENDSPGQTKEWILKHTKKDSIEQNDAQYLIDVVGLAASEGNYSLRIVAFDVFDSTRTASLTLPVFVPSFSTTTPEMSSIAFCSNIIKAESEEEKLSPFYKNSYLAFPNPNRIFGQSLPTLFYYVECYNLLTSLPEEYSLTISIENALQNELLHHEKKKRRSVNNTVEVGVLPINTLLSGTYSLHLSLSTNSGVAATSSKKFFVFNPLLGVDTTLRGFDTLALANEFSSLTNEEIGEHIGMISYIAAETEKNQVALLTTNEAKQNFLIDFWKRRTFDSLGTTISLKNEYYRRIAHANDQFTGAKNTQFPTAGWKTDMGRIYIVYGKPDEIKRRPSSPDFGPYEIWDYHQLQGGVSFYFVDEFNNNQSRLVHSSATGEIKDPRWSQRIQTMETTR
ncbi:MAG: GWxTD domain-containing protein [Ignavibacteriales bacterium]|nr:GWxTD domain-containing protein [Ignavibacteriales bacterium]